MDIQAQTAAQQSLSQSAAASNTGSANPLSSDFETFLLMLTTQMENQDPLNPVESEDFAVQLATFSGVEQQVRTNDLLESLASGLGLTGLAELAGWVGMKARVEAPVAFDGAPVEVAINPDPGSDGAELIVTDSFGREVSRQEVPMGVETIEWVGIGQNGQPLPSGQYTLQLASQNQGEITSTKQVSHYATIREARQGLDGVELVFPGGVVVGAESVSALRSADGL